MSSHRSIRKENLRRLKARRLLNPQLAVPLTILLLILALIFIPLERTGLMVVNIENSYGLDEGLIVDEDYEYMLPFSGNLTSLKIDGKVVGDGSAKVFLKAGLESYLAYDSIDNIIGPLSSTASFFSGGDIGISVVRENEGSMYEMHVSGNISEKLCALWQINDERLCYGEDMFCALADLSSLGVPPAFQRTQN